MTRALIQYKDVVLPVKGISLSPYHHNGISYTGKIAYLYIESATSQSVMFIQILMLWWRHQMETFSALLVIFAGNSAVSGQFPAQRPVTRTFDVFFDIRLNKRLSKQWWCWWFETLSRSLWRHRNVLFCFRMEWKRCSKWLYNWLWRQNGKVEKPQNRKRRNYVVRFFRNLDWIFKELCWLMLWLTAVCITELSYWPLENLVIIIFVAAIDADGDNDDDEGKWRRGWRQIKIHKAILSKYMHKEKRKHAPLRQTYRPTISQNQASQSGQHLTKII